MTFTLIGIAVVGVLFLVAVYAVWRAHEEGKAERDQQRRRELDSFMALTHDFPPPKGPRAA